MHETFLTVQISRLNLPQNGSLISDVIREGANFCSRNLTEDKNGYSDQKSGSTESPIDVLSFMGFKL